MVQIRDTEKSKVWEERIADFLSSELTQKAWCEEKEFQITNWHTGYENTERKIWSHQSVDG